MYGFTDPNITLSQSFISPDELFGTLFQDVQNSHIFSDSKTFADCIPLDDPYVIIKKYKEEKDNIGFDLTKFVVTNFKIPAEIKSSYVSDVSLNTEEHIRNLWPLLTFQPESQETGGSLIPLPYPYVVPGGRFREIYYWDSYFTMLGLRECGRTDLIQNMINNFSFLLDNHGLIPTGNRTYYLSRSQPPFFSLMVRLLSEINGKKVLINYLPQLRKEYDYWMEDGGNNLQPFEGHRRVVQLPDGVRLNRYWDDRPEPRPEAFHEDVALAHEANSLHGTPPKETYLNVRAAAESGWDFSSRWFKKEDDFTTIHTTELLPVDLNCLMYNLEMTLAEAYLYNEEYDLNREFTLRASQRCEAIQHYFWCPVKKFYMDYDFVERRASHAMTLAGTYPMFFKLTPKLQAKCVRNSLRINFLRSGGLVTTLVRTGQQWDSPNGWAPLQWIAYKGLRNYNFHRTANELSAEWLTLNEKEFKHIGKMMEKYNVLDTYLEAGGGEYEVQEGFGWTNGVYLRMKNKKH